MDTTRQRVKRETQLHKIIAALIDGRTISLFDSAEFEVSEMHTCICYVRKKIDAGLLPGWVMKDRWTTNENQIRYKEYWFERENG